MKRELGPGHSANDLEIQGSFSASSPALPHNVQSFIFTRPGRQPVPLYQNTVWLKSSSKRQLF